eukprot:gene13700-4610_t
MRGTGNYNEQGNLVIRIDSVMVSYFLFAFTMSASAVVLNMLMINIIRKRWQRITDFELIILNLAVADCLTGVFFISWIGVETYSFQNQTNIHPDVLFGFYSLLFVSATVSVILLILLGIGQLFAVMMLPTEHGLFHMKRRRVHAILALIWASAIIFSAAAVMTELKAGHKNGEKNPSNSACLNFVYRALVLLRSFTLPGLFSCVMFYILKRTARLTEFDKDDCTASNGILTASWKKKQTLVVYFLVVASFLICSTPFLFAMHKGEMMTLALVSNSAINPLIYLCFQCIDQKSISSANELI